MGLDKYKILVFWVKLLRQKSIFWCIFVFRKLHRKSFLKPYQLTKIVFYGKILDSRPKKPRPYIIRGVRISRSDYPTPGQIIRYEGTRWRKQYPLNLKDSDLWTINSIKRTKQWLDLLFCSSDWWLHIRTFCPDKMSLKLVSESPRLAQIIKVQLKYTH